MGLEGGRVIDGGIQDPLMYEVVTPWERLRSPVKMSLSCKAERALFLSFTKVNTVSNKFKNVF